MYVAKNLEKLERIHPTYEECKQRHGKEWYKHFHEDDSTAISRASLIRNIEGYHRKWGTSNIIELISKGFLGYDCIKDKPDLVADLKRYLEGFKDNE